MISLGDLVSIIESWHYEEGRDKDVFKTACDVLDYIKSVRDVKNYNITGRDIESDNGGFDFAICKVTDREYDILKNDIESFIRDNKLYGNLSYNNTQDGYRILSIVPNKLDRTGGVISESYHQERTKKPNTEFGMKVESGDKNKAFTQSVKESTVSDTDKLSEIYKEYNHLIKWCRMDDESFYNINPFGPEYTEAGECIFAFSDCRYPKSNIDNILEVLNNNKPIGCEEVYTTTEGAKIFYVAKVSKDIIYQTESSIYRSTLIDNVNKVLEEKYNTKAHINKNDLDKFLSEKENEICIGAFGKEYNTICKSLQDNIEEASFKTDDHWTIYMTFKGEVVKEESIKKAKLHYGSDDLYKRKKIDRSIMKVSESTVINKSSFTIPELEIEPLTEAEIQSDEKCPVYIVTVFTGSAFGKLITKVTDSSYSHAALSFDADLSKLYSFNVAHSKGKFGGGFSNESISQYIEANKDSIMQVNVLFVKKKDYKKLQKNLDKFLTNAQNTSYNALNTINVVINKAKENTDELSMICSQFVDYMFKAINLDITNKPSNLVTPANLSSIVNPKVYKIYEGRTDKYNPDNIRRDIKRLSKKAEFVKESAIVLEARSLPIEFNSKGDLLVKNPKGINIEAEHAVSKKIFPSYKKYKDLDGMKYEVCKLWYLNTLLLQKIDNNPKDKEELYTLRSKVLTEHSLYLNEILKNDPSFNFAEYYESTPFGEAHIKISGSTITHSINLFKQIIK